LSKTQLDEKTLVEIPAHEIFKELYDEVQYGPDFHPGKPNQERTSLTEVILKDRLKTALKNKVCPGLPEQAYEMAITKIEGLSSSNLLENNRAFHEMLLSGIKVQVTNDTGKTETIVVKLVDFENINNNDFLAVRQFYVTQHATRKVDHVIFINGLPLVLLEYKDPAKKSETIKKAYDQLGVTKYQRFIPKLFNYTVFVVVSDRTLAKYGTITAPFVRFFKWTDPIDKKKKIVNQLDYLQRHMLNKDTLLDIIQNYIEYEFDGKQITKKIGQQHQCLGVNNLIESTKKIFPRKDENRAGVIFHASGGGKSLSMIFYVQSLSQIEEFENPTFVVITDTNDLDEQIEDKFKISGFPFPRAPTSIMEAENIKDLRNKLQIPAGKIIFTTIQKFQVTKEEREGKVRYPKISDRRNIIIIADEAHRSQYKKLARNLSTALPNAIKVGFTGTPIELADRSTTDVFGPIISAYTIPDSRIDETTVKISYEGHLDNLHLLNQYIGKDFDDLTESLSEDATAVLSRKWSGFKRLVENPKRIQTISEDVVKHLNGRLKRLKGKAMLVASSRNCANMFYNKITSIPGHPECICVISGTKIKKIEGDPSIQTIEEKLQDHIRSKKEEKELIEKFKDENNPIKLLIVCDKYLTGFDAPLLHTMYIDKPIRDHNLIQTISRVNRVWKSKPGGLIIDYIGIADDLTRAYKAFGTHDIKEAMTPTTEIISLMQQKHKGLINFFKCNITKRDSLNEFEQTDLIYTAIDEVLESEESKKWFFENVAELTISHTICNPNPLSEDVDDDLDFFKKITRIISKGTSNAPIIEDETDSAIQELVEKGISSDKIIRRFGIDQKDKSVIDLEPELLDKIKNIPQKNLRVEVVHKLLDDAIKARFRRNVIARKSFLDEINNSLRNYYKRFEDVDSVTTKLVKIAKKIKDTKRREEELGLTEEEAIFYDAVSQGKEFVKSDEALKEVAVKLTECLKKNTTIDWMNQDSIKAKIISEVKKILRNSGFGLEGIEKILPLVMIQADNVYRYDE